MIQIPIYFESIVKRAKVIQMVVKYDNNNLMSWLLVVVLEFLNPNFDGVIKPKIINGENECIFGVVTMFNEATLQ